jgi:hypothetical protein
VSSIGTFGYGVGLVKYTYPQGVSFEYALVNSVLTLSRIYVVDSYQSQVQVLDGATKTYLGVIGGYGFGIDKLFVPSDVFFDSKDPLNNRIVVANGGGSVSLFGLDSLQANNVYVQDPTVVGQLTVNWSTPANPAFTSVSIFRSTVQGSLGGLIPAATNLTGVTTFTDTGLTQFTPYYYTVRAYGATPTQYVDSAQVSATTLGTYSLTIAPNGTGAGTVNTSCVGSCGNINAILSGTSMTLTASATGSSTFTQWASTSDVCADSTSPICTFAMDSNKVAIATFTAPPSSGPFKVGVTQYATLKEAYAAVADNGKIMIKSGVQPSVPDATIMTADAAKTVTLEGGYDDTFAVITATPTVITGRINVSDGKIIMNQVKVQ